MAVPRRNGSSTTALAAVLALGHFLLLATHSDACGSSCPKPTPMPPPAPCSPPTPKARGGGARCPVNALKLGACASVLGGLVSLELGQQQRPAASSSSSTQPCCQLLGGLADLDAAVCLCTALRANVLGIVQLSTHVELSVLVNYCGKKLPQGFRCARAN
ncbi:putative lipid-binding protein AIR1 [Miscanthus floridulus]|uniref:putative lipid-binding protein AIR1 n=1 Tax=Miscanthus floridulus TaxID=154761 RepID=UPI003458604F